MKNVFLIPTRFDIGAKYAYALFRERGINCNWALDVYKRHLEVWNGFKEYDTPDKNTFQKFVDCFHTLLDSIKSDGFDDAHPIPMSATGLVLNGIHRAAACILYDVEPSLYISTDTLEYGGWQHSKFDYKVFQTLGLEKKYTDYMALEYVKLNPKSYVFLVFPSVKGDALDIINKYGSVIYKKEITLTPTGAYNLIRQLYRGESWVTEDSNGFSVAAYNKAMACWYNSTTEPMKMYIADFDTFELSKTCKTEARRFLNMETPNRILNHSCHTTDNHEESVRISRVLLNDNSIHFINKMNIVHNEQYESWLKMYKKYISDHNWNTDDFCITASGVLTMYGLRDCNDLDYLHHYPDQQIKAHPLIHSHEVELNKYTLEKDDIIYNPTNYFYFDDIKFASLDVIRGLKEKRSEPKDVIDVSYIDKLLLHKE